MRHLANTPPADAREVRISGVSGSGHRGTWQFTGFVTWLYPAGTIQGGGTELPQTADNQLSTSGSPPNGSRPSTASAGPPVRSSTRYPLRDLDAGLAMVEIAITVEATTVIGCTAASINVTATCARFDTSGGVVDRFPDRLLVDTGLDAAGVQRQSVPLTPPIEG